MDMLKKLPPEIDYLAKDYASFRRLMLDHLALRVPDWNEVTEADVGIVLVELLAYLADYLSYYQDAVATEAYPGTARLRSSIKRHVRLLDYVLQEGCNARAWVQIQVNDVVQLPEATQLLTLVNGPAHKDVTIAPTSAAYEETLQLQPKIFETLYDATLHPELNEIWLYAEEGADVTLDVGTTEAALCVPAHQHLPLKVGDVLIFEEVKSVTTGSMLGGVDPERRQAVRVAGIRRSRSGSQELAHVTWAEQDAFMIPLRIASRQYGQLCVARGNIVLADQGMTIRHEDLPAVLPDQRYRPRLFNPALTHALPYNHAAAQAQPASALMAQDLHQARPVISLFQKSLSNPLQLSNGDEGGNIILTELQDSPLMLSATAREQFKQKGVALSTNVGVREVPDVGWELHDRLYQQYWLVTQESGTLYCETFKKWNFQPDLLSSGPLSNDYTVDMEDDGRATLRFGFGTQGKQPLPGDDFRVTYRIGGNQQGNVRSDTISHLVVGSSAIHAAAITRVRNPLPGWGGADPNPLEEARFAAPTAYREQQRCITESDYVNMVKQYPAVLNAVARQRWIGSWPVTVVYVQRAGVYDVDAAFRGDLTNFMQPFLLTGQSIEIRGPEYVGLRIKLRVHVRSHVAQSVMRSQLALAFSNKLGDGNGPDGYFYADNFSFGQAVYQSKVIARVMAIPGVSHVEVEQFCRYDAPTPGSEDPIQMQPVEIARLDNDPAAPYNGSIEFDLRGGL